MPFVQSTVRNGKWAVRGAVQRGRRAFTLIEMLVVIGIIALLTALLLPALSRAGQNARSSSCMGLEKQIGLGLQMYVLDNQCYPPLAEPGSAAVCFDRLYAYYPLSWTNAAWNCPSYTAAKGLISRDAVETYSYGISYSYNSKGIATGWAGTPKGLRLGLGHLPTDIKKEPQVVAPSHMYAVADARSQHKGIGVVGGIKMVPWAFENEAAPPHGNAYNMLFCDGHVALLKRGNYLYPPRTASHWNSDDQPHPELWPPVSMWAVQD